MADYPAKHEFVDDYPYLAYASEVDTIAGSGGEGGGEGSYTLPIASANTLGGVKIGSGLAIDNDGVLSSSGGGGGDDLLYVIDFIYDDDGENVYGIAYHNNVEITGNDIDTVVNQGKVPVMFDTFKIPYYYNGKRFEGGAYVQRFECIELIQSGGTVTSIKGQIIDMPDASTGTNKYTVTKTFS